MAGTAAALNILVNAQVAGAMASLKAVDAQLKKTAATATGTSGAFGKFNKGAVGAAAGFAAVGAAAVIAGKQLYDVGKELDSAYDKIRAGTGATGKQLEQLKKDFRAVAGQVPADLEETGTAIADLNTRLGLTGKPLRQMARQMLELSEVTGSDLEGSIKGVSRAFVDWEVPVRKQTKTLDGFFRLSQASGSSVEEITTLIQQFGSPLRTLGFNVEEAASMFAQFERAGVNIQTMVPGLKLAIGNLSDGSGKAGEQMKKWNIDGKNLHDSLFKIFRLVANEGIPVQDRMNLAMGIFGKRAGADMKEAIEQGRFNLEKFMDIMKHGKDTVHRTAMDTRDLSENMKILSNRLKILVAPAASTVFNWLGQVSAALVGVSKGGDKARKSSEKFEKQNRTLMTVLRTVWSVIKTGVSIFKLIMDSMFDTGKTMQRLREVVRNVGDSLEAIFDGTWLAIRTTFRNGANSVIDIVNAIIGVINRIPGVDIGKVGKIYAELHTGPVDPTPHKRRQRGGMLSGGAPSGDSIPALLERGEYVLNRKAVQAAGGPQVLDHLNFKQASRFQTGGPVGLSIGGDAWNAAKGVAGKIVGKGAGFFIGKLPKPDLPPPLTALGPWVIKQVEDWIKGKVKGPGDPGGPLGGFSGSLTAAMNMARSHGLTITSTTGGTHAPGSYHYSGRAFDASNGSSPTPQMMSYFMDAAGKWGKSITELFYDPVGWYIKYGSKVPGAIGDHSDHVHTAFQKGGVVKGRVSYFGGQNTAGGKIADRDAGLALNLRPGTDSGWNNAKTQKWMAASNAGRPYYADVGIAGHSAVLPIIDLGPAGWVNRAIDVTTPGISKLGFNTGNFPTDADGVAYLLGQSRTPRKGSPSYTGGGSKGGSGGGGKKKVKHYNPATGGVIPTNPQMGKAGDLAERTKKIAKRWAARRKAVLSKISGKGGNYPGKKAIAGLDTGIAGALERLDVMERLGSASDGPGGSELTNAELEQQIAQVYVVLEAYERQRKYVEAAIAFVSAARARFQKLYNGEVKKGGKYGWKRKAYKKAIGNADAALGSPTGDGLLGKLKELVGVTGTSGAIFDTRMRLRELGDTTTFEGAANAARDSEIAALLREQLSTSQRALAISQAQMPIFQQFMPKYHTGGVIPGGGERPVMAMGGEGIFTRDQMAAMGGGPMEVYITVEDGAVDASRIRAEVKGYMGEVVTKTRTGRSGRKYVTNG